MWLMTREGAFSVIRWHDGRMCVRARMPGDIDRLRLSIPKLGPEELSPTKDYRYRAFVDREGLAEGFANLAGTIDYGNFKGAVDASERPIWYKRGLHEIWSVMASWQPGGAYGQGKGQDVPKAERKREEAARRADKQRQQELIRLKSGTPCEDCGAVRADSEMGLYGSRWLCRDVSDCRPEFALTK